MERERKLIGQCQLGNIEAFEELIIDYEKKAYNIAYKVLRNEQDAMDASQESFIKVYKNIKTFEFQSSFSTWLYRIVMNTSLDMKRKTKEKHLSLNETYDNGKAKIELIDERASLDLLLERKLSKEMIQLGISQLEENHRNVIILRDIEGFSYDEISDILNCSVGTVKSRISRGRIKLKNWIENQYIRKNT